MTCHGIDRAFTHPEVCIGWYPATAVVATKIRTQPGGGHIVRALKPGAGLGLQSGRNPEACPEPALRVPIVGPDDQEYFWCYSRAGRFAGWVRARDVDFDSRAEDKAPLLGPTAKDFEVGRTLPQPRRQSGCGRPVEGEPEYLVSVRDTLLRYSERGAAFHYLHEGDLVRLLLVGAPHGFAFCEVIQVGPGASLRPGTRGWVPQAALEEA